MERGPLAHPEATEFNNCEVRIYTLVYTPEGDIEKPSKCIYSNASLCTLQMRNFPASWVDCDEDPITELPRKVDALLHEFGELREPPEVWQSSDGTYRVSAAFTEQSAAAAAALRLHGRDVRSEEEKKSRSTACDRDRFHAQVTYDII